MTAPTPTIGRIREPGREGLDLDPHALLELFLRWEPLYTQADVLPTLPRGSAGRPPDFPPVMALVFQFLYWVGHKSSRKVAAVLRNERTWRMVCNRLAPRYPDHVGFSPGAAPYDRSDYRRYAKTYGVVDSTFRSLYDEFTAYFTVQAQAMGMFDPTQGSLTHPEPTNLLSGDVTVMRAIYDAAPGEMWVNPMTGEIRPKRYDPDARWRQTGDKRSVYGTPFGFLSGTTGRDGERLVLGMFQTEDDAPDPEEGMRAMACAEHLRGLLPGAQGLVYDKALRGKHVQIGYEIDLPVFAKVAREKGLRLRSRSVGPCDFKLVGGGRRRVKVWAIDGAPHIETMTAGQVQHLRLTRGQIMKRTNKASGRPRWYCSYSVPDDPTVAPELRGASLILRLDRPKGEGTWWTEAIRAIPEGDPDWQKVFGRRNASENVNRWLKDFTRDNRAPCVGRAQQRFALLCGALAANFKAIVLFCERRGLAIPGLGPP